MIRNSRLRWLSWVLTVSASTLLGCGSDATPPGGGAGAPASGGAGGSVSGASGSSGTANTAGGSAAGAAQGGAATAGAPGGGASNAGSGGTSSAGAAGASTAGAAGTSGAGGGTTQPSAGCMMPAGQALHSWVAQPDMMVKGVARKWWVWLPNNYDPSKTYPVIFLFHGCGAADNVVPMQNATNDQAILVRGAGMSANGCWDQSPDGVDMTFFDQMLALVPAQRCVDTKRVFVVGYSSGSWLVNSIDCRRADKIRGAASVSGGVQSNNCAGKVARIFLHDKNDPENDIKYSYQERDRLIGLNHCSMTTMPDDPSPCVRYQGCDAGYPIDFCETTGKGHDRQDSLAPGAFWKFFSSL